ncbi:TraB/GumN family protein [Undibacterium fentianense]|uniref:TraB/GumN family protein n=1 Tax=Undibacterium fentianense TaxID=2828728 RepID=A0A941IG41_9BURK|nr:TraB/GumN family protein [Undibacterium fentianense]MBR7801406.1 TraB/GumN family protein [Undibacterium fentianense]
MHTKRTLHAPRLFHFGLTGIISLTCLTLSLFAIANSKLPSPQSKVSANLQATPGKMKGVFYEISLAKQADAKANQTVRAYLYGTIHFAKPSFYPLPKIVSRAFAQADTVVVEADNTDESASPSIVAKLSYAEPDKLENHLSPTTWNRLKSMTGAASQQFQQYQPVLVAMGLSISVGQQMGYDPAAGLDRYFILEAKKAKKELFETEGLNYQTDVLSSLSDDEGNALLAATLEAFQKGEVKREFQSLAQAWLEGDSQKLSRVFLESSRRDIGSQKITQRLIDDRNPAIAKKIHDLMLSNKKLFIVMGSGHFAGEQNLIDQLKQLGLQVRALP